MLCWGVLSCGNASRSAAVGGRRVRSLRKRGVLIAHPRPRDTRRYCKKPTSRDAGLTGSSSRETVEEKADASIGVKREAAAETDAAQKNGILQRAMQALHIEDDPKRNRSLLVLAVISGLWTLSNLMIVSILPVYMKVELGLSNAKIGALEGAAIFAAFFSKVFSGVVSDMLRSRVAVIAVGALMTAIVKPAIAAAGLVKSAFGANAAFYWLFSAKITDRLSKGVRAAPVDALVADLSQSESRNRAYSLNHSMATFGGVLGSLLCSAMMFATGSSYEVVFLSAAIPACLAILLLFSHIEQPQLTQDDEKSVALKSDTAGAKTRESFRSQIAGVRELPPQFLFSAVIVATLYLARFSETFVILRAKSVGVPMSVLPLMLTVNQLVQSVLTYPVGVMADRLSSKAILFIGYCFLIAANLVFISMPSTVGMALGFVLIGVHLSMTHANTKSLLSAALKPTQRGAGFAMFAVISGISLAAGNILAGVLNDKSSRLGLGLIGCFYGGIAATVLSGAMLALYYALFPTHSKPSTLSK